MSSAHRLCAEVIAACRSVTQPGPRRAVLEIFGSRTLHRTGTEAPLTDRRGPVPEACRDVFCTPLAPAGGLLPVNGVAYTEVPHHLDQNRSEERRVGEE